MRLSLRHKYLSALSAFVLLFQLFAPTLAMASGGSPSLICNPSGQISTDMQTAVKELKEVLGIEDAKDTVMDCQDCVSSVYNISTPQTTLSAPVQWSPVFITPTSHEFTLAKPRGPPLGSRAPPYSL